MGALRGHELLDSRWFSTVCFLRLFVVSGKRWVRLSVVLIAESDIFSAIVEALLGGVK
jgi:hypothetical protein